MLNKVSLGFPAASILCLSGVCGVFYQRWAGRLEEYADFHLLLLHKSKKWLMVWVRHFQVYWYGRLRSATGDHPLSTCFFSSVSLSSTDRLTLYCLWDRTVWMNKSSVEEPEGWPQNSWENRPPNRKAAATCCIKTTRLNLLCWGAKQYSSDWVNFFFYSLLKPDQNDDLLQRPSLAPHLPSPHLLLANSSPTGSRFSLRALVVYF